LKEEIDMARIKGKSIIFEVDNTEYQGGVSNVVFSSSVGTLGFGDYEDSLDFNCAITGFQDTAAASLHSYLWDNPGKNVTITYAPHGNETATTAQPHFTATGYVETVPNVGGAAGEYFVYDLNIILDGKPTKVTA
jgi:hypothetical protein